MAKTLGLVLMAVCAVAACTPGTTVTGDGVGDKSKEPSVNITDEMKACAKDGDCVKLESPCCQCEEPAYINKTFQKDVSAMIDNACKKMGEEGLVCTDMYCMHKEAACVENKCAANPSDVGGGGSDVGGGGSGEGGGSGGGKNARRWEIPDWLTPGMSACSKNEDCVVSSWGCCDYCNGGKPVPVNNASLAAVSRINNEACGENIVCTLRACEIPPALCFNNKCDMFIWEDLDRSSPVNHCNADTDCTVMEMACCDHCNGGKAAGVNRTYQGLLDEYKKQFFCIDPCTQVDCPALNARCVENKCE